VVGMPQNTPLITTGVIRVSNNAKPWRAQISISGETLPLGYFGEEDEAARAFDAAVVAFGLSDRSLNFPEKANQQVSWKMKRSLTSSLSLTSHSEC